MALELPFGLKVLNPLPVDDKYLSGGTPYTSVSAVNTAIPAPIRHQGLTVNVNGIEYWYKDGVADIDLVLKTSDGGTASGERIEKRFTKTAHGFVVGEAVGYSGGTFVKAIAITDFDGETLGVVSEVDSPSGFTVVFAGYVTGMTSYGFNPNTTYFLSDIVAGGYREDTPTTTGSTIKPMLTTFADPDEILVFQYLGFAVTTGTTGSASGITDGVNVGIGDGLVFKEVSGDTMVFRSIEGTGGTVVSTVGDTIYISGGSAIAQNLEIWTVSDTITDEDVVAFSGISGTSYTVTLPATPNLAKEIRVVDITGTANSSNITILGGTESILDGSTIINTSFGSVDLQWTGVGWKVVSFIN